MEQVEKKRPTFGMNPVERLERYRDGLIDALVRRMKRVRHDLNSPTPPNVEKREFVRRKTARMVAEIRRVSLIVGPKRD